MFRLWKKGVIFTLFFAVFFFTHSTQAAAQVNQSDLTSVLQGIVAAQNNGGMTPIVRVGVNGAQGYDNPQTLVDFIVALSARPEVTGDVYFIAGPNEPESETWAAPQCGIGDGACMGGPVAAYMNTIITGARGLPHIKLLSPAFNLCSPVFPSLIGAMGAANWGGLDGIAANVYDHAPAGPGLDRISDCINTRSPLLPNLPIILTETGAFNVDQNSTGNLNDLRDQLGWVATNSRIHGALLFDAFGTNPDFVYAHLSDAQIRFVCGDGPCSARKVGINFATVYTQGDYPHANALGMRFTLEILGSGGGQRSADLRRFHFLQYPCDATTSPEFHPLRPYPFSPCDPLIPARNTLAFTCGNSFTATGSFTYQRPLRSKPYNEETPMTGLGSIDPNNPPTDSSPYHNGSQTGPLYQCGGRVCAVERIPFNMTVDLTLAKLPVIGNTEQSSRLTDAAKVNNYLDWYLSGTVNSSEYRPLGSSVRDYARLVNFSGPLQKLLPRQIQRNIRIIVRYSTFRDIHNYLISGYGSARIASAYESIFRNVPLASMEDTTSEILLTVIPSRQTDPANGGHTITTPPPPVGDPNRNLNLSRNAIVMRIRPGYNTGDSVQASNSRIYMPHVRETAWLSDLLQNYANPYDLAEDVQNYDKPNDLRLTNVLDTYYSINAASGSLSAVRSQRNRNRLTLHQDAHQGTAEDTGDRAPIQFVWMENGWSYNTDTPTRNTEVIDNPQDLQGHNEVVVQGTRITPYDPNVLNLVGNPALGPDAPFIPSRAGCSLSSVRASPGDSMVDSNGWLIYGLLEYTATFQFDPYPDYQCATLSCRGTSGCGDCGTGWECRQDFNACCADIWAAGGICDMSACGGTCTPGDRNTGGIPTQVTASTFSKAPFLKGIYSSLVTSSNAHSSASVLRRFLPYPNPTLMPQSPKCEAGYGEFLKGENPADLPENNHEGTCIKYVPSQVNFTTSPHTQGSNNHPSVPSGGGTSTAGEVFFPYLGSTRDYILGAGCDPLNLQRLLRPYGMAGPGCSAPSTQVKRKFVAIVIGQSNAASFGESPHNSVAGVYCLHNTQLTPATDPLCGTDGQKGSVWTRLGDLLMATGNYDEVVFIPAAVGSSDVASWVPGRSNYHLVNQAIIDAQSLGLTVTHILWHQGETDAWVNHTSANDYRNSLNSLISSIRSRGVSAPFLVALASRCDPNFPNRNTDINDGQRAVTGTNNVSLGPDSDALKETSAYRSPGDECHFSTAGLQAHAQAWLSAINGVTPGVAPGNCIVPASGYCSTATLTPAFGANANAFAYICQRESGGIPGVINTNCLNASSRDYSVGLLQINLLASPDPTWVQNSADAESLRQLLTDNGYDYSNPNSYVSSAIRDNWPAACTILNQALLNLYVSWFSDPQNNIAYARYLFLYGGGWRNWGGQPACAIQ